MRYNWKLPIIVICVVLISILGMTFMVHGPKNTAISYEEQIQEAKSGIEIQEKRRADLIPNLVETVKAYDQHEYQTLMDVVNARGTSGQTAQEITTQIAAIAEAYPELKSSDNYKELMNELSVTENLIANYRGDYNRVVKEYKQSVRKFPNSFLLGLTGYEVQNYEYLSYEGNEAAPAVGNLFGNR